MDQILEMALDCWDANRLSSADREQALHHLEAGHVLYFPRLACPVEHIQPFLDTEGTSGHSKNVSFDPSTGKIRGSRLDAALDENLRRAMGDYAALTGVFL